MSATRRQKNLVLILAREFASKLATATFLTDESGDLVYYNEAAEELLGQPYAQMGELPAARWADLWAITDLEGSPLESEQTPGGRALLERRPVHFPVRITALDDVRRELSVTALPLFAHPGELVGMLAIFWQPDDARA
jgi:PAS domain-containing protein